MSAQDDNWDPIYAVGFRFGLPVASNFLEKNAEGVLRHHGQAMLDDLRAVLSGDDWDAAVRIAVALRPDADIFAVREDDKVKISIVEGAITSDTTMMADTPAIALVNAVTGFALSIKQGPVGRAPTA